MGAVIGTKAGKGTINEELNKPLLEKYHRDSVRQFVKIEKPLGMPGNIVHKGIKSFTGGLELKDKAVENLQDMAGFEFTDKALKGLSGKISDEGKMGVIKSLKGRKLIKGKLVEGLTKSGFDEKEIEAVLLETRNEEAAEKLGTMKPILNKKLSKKKLIKELNKLDFNEKEIGVILGQADFAYSEGLAKTIGGAVGSVTGTVLGALGGAAVGFKWGSKFAGLFGRNYVKEKFGELPKHPYVESILRRDYGEN